MVLMPYAVLVLRIGAITDKRLKLIKPGLVSPDLPSLEGASDATICYVEISVIEEYKFILSW